MGRILTLLCAVTALSQPSMAAQGRPMPMPLGDGRIALLGNGPSGPRVLAVLRPESGGHAAVDQTPTDLAPNDRILAFAGTESPTLDTIRAAFEAARVGARIELRVDRGGRTVAVAFTRPEGRMGQLGMGPSTDKPSSSPAEGWVSAGPRESGALSIAGFSIRADAADRPVVGFRGSHPAQGTVALEPGDLVRAIGGKEVASLVELVSEYDAVAEGGTVILDVVRAGAPRRVTFAKPAP